MIEKIELITEVDDTKATDALKRLAKSCKDAGDAIDAFSKAGTDAFAKVEASVKSLNTEIAKIAQSLPNVLGGSFQKTSQDITSSLGSVPLQETSLQIKQMGQDATVAFEGMTSSLSQYIKESQEAGKKLKDLRAEQRALQEAREGAVINSQEFHAYNEALHDVTQSIRDLTSRHNEAGKGVNGLRQRMRELQMIIQNSARDTQAYKDAVKEFGDLRTKMGEEMQMMKASADGWSGSIDNVNNNINVLASGLQAYSAAAAMTGVTSENAAEMLVKMQAAMQMGNAIRDFNEGIKAARVSLRSLNITMSANPALALAAAVTALIAVLTVLTRWYVSGKDKTEEYTKAQEAFNDSLAETKRQMERNIQVMQAEGKSAEEIQKQKIANLEEEMRQREANVKAIEEERAKEEEAYKERVAMVQRWGKIFLTVQNFAFVGLAKLIDVITGSDLVGWLNDTADAALEWFSDMVGAKDNFDKLEELDGENKKQLEANAQQLEDAKFELELQGIRARTEANKKETDAQIAEYNKRQQEAQKAAEERLRLEQELTNALIKLQETREERIRINEKEATAGEERIKYIQREIENIRAQALIYSQITNDVTKSAQDRLKAVEALMDAESTLASLTTELQETTKEYTQSLIEQETLRAQRITDIQAERDALLLLYQDEEARRVIRDMDFLNEQERKAAELAYEKDKLQTTLARLNEEEVAQQAHVDAMAAMYGEDSDNYLSAIKTLKDITKERIKTESDVTKNQEQQDAIKAELRKKDLQNAMSAADGFGNVLGTVASAVGENTKAFKALKVAETTIDTITGAIKAFMSYQSIPVVGQALGAAAAAAVTAAGVMNIKKIVSTEIPNTQGSSSTPAIETPAFESVGTVALPSPEQQIQNTYTEGYNDQAITQLNEGTRVYVLESDISQTQNNVKNNNKVVTF